MHSPARQRGVHAVLLLESAVHCPETAPMIELNPIRQRIADLKGRVESLRGYL